MTTRSSNILNGYHLKRYTDIMLGCFVLDNKTTFTFDINDDIKSVTQFRSAIWNKYLKNLVDIHEKHLKLWKVDIPAGEENDKLNILLNKSHGEINIEKDLGGEVLDPLLLIARYFPTIPLDEHIHIIIQLDNGQRYTNDIANVGYVPRQKGLGGTSLSLDGSLNKKKSHTNEGISLDDPDTSKRSEIVQSLINDLLEQNVILVQAPPYSGKTSLAQLIEHHLINSQNYSEYRVIRISLLWGRFVGVKSNYETFERLWEELIKVDWIEWVGQCQKIKTILIIDEVQFIYKHEQQIDGNTKGSAYHFWETVKGCLQEYSSLSIIMFAAYGYGTNSAGLSTPVEIPPENSRDLTDIKFTYDELRAYVEKYCCNHFEKLSSVEVSKFNKYIQTVTEGHAGLVRHLLKKTKTGIVTRVRSMEKMTFQDIFGYLNSTDFNATIDLCRAAPKLKSFSTSQTCICESVHLEGKIPYRSSRDIDYLVRSGILVIEKNYLRFAAPLIMRSFFQQNYGQVIYANSAPESLYDFIKKVFTVMCEESSEILRKSLGFGMDENLRILEQTWQKEFYRIGVRELGYRYFLSCDVGAVFGCNGKIDFYVDGKDWAIEILREGLDMKEHDKRFNEATGRYKEIVKVSKEVAIVNIRSDSKKVRELEKRFMHISYSDNYNSFTIECLGKDPLTVKGARNTQSFN